MYVARPLPLPRSLPLRFVLPRPHKLLGTHRRDLHNVNARIDQQLMSTTLGTAIRGPYPKEYRLVNGLIGRMEDVHHGHTNHA
jgi:hypothetical protein